MLFDTPFYLIVHPSLPVNNVGELINYIRANPGKLSFGSIGVEAASTSPWSCSATASATSTWCTPPLGSAAAPDGFAARR
jgi:tripartite-type tricarboxylate transporter receptor subunit TctC